MKRRKTAPRVRIPFLWAAVVIGVVLFGGSYFAATASCRRNAARAADDALEFVKAQVLRYDAYVSDSRTKSLIRLMDKLEALNDILELTGGEPGEERLTEFFDEQRFTGLVVLDGGLGELAAVGDTAPMAELLDSDAVRSVAAYPEKCYMTQFKTPDGQICDFAAIARRGGGLLAACLKKAPISTVNGDISLDSLFSNYTFDMDGAAVVTDDKYVLSTNREWLFGRPITDVSDIVPGGMVLERDGLYSAAYEGRTWYGKMLQVKNYALYVYFPEKEVFASRTVFLGYGLLSYVLVWLCFTWLRQRAARAQTEKIRTQYQTIGAIMDAYAAGFLLHLPENRFEQLRGTENLDALLGNARTAEELIDVLAEKSVSADFRDGFRVFADPATLAARLRDQNDLSYTSRSVHDLWFQTLLIPQERAADGTPTAVLLMVRNVTEEKKRELRYQKELERTAAEAERANAAKTGFLRRMSHDLRTPLNGIRGMVEISSRFPGDEEKQNECRQKIMDTSGFLLELVNSMLDMSKLESGETQLESKPFDLGGVISSINVVVENEARNRGITYRCEELGLEHTALIGSPMHVQQILQNIAVNAVKYNRPNGSVTLTCRETGCADGFASFEFTCADTGIGMSEEFQAHAFEPFSQESDHSSKNGIGLGLSIARELTEKMGGTIRFTSRLGEGTTFVVTMRFALNNAAAEPVTESGEHISLQGCRVLVAEDNALNMEIAKFLLEERGAEVIPATNGREAAECFAASEPGRFDLILMDVMMPELNGLQAAQRIRAMDRPDAGTVPILAMTANAFADDVEQSLAAGMDAHLCKPLDSDLLAAVVYKFWKHGRAADGPEKKG